MQLQTVETEASEDKVHQAQQFEERGLKIVSMRHAGGKRIWGLLGDADSVRQVRTEARARARGPLSASRNPDVTDLDEQIYLERQRRLDLQARPGAAERKGLRGLLDAATKRGVEVLTLVISDPAWREEFLRAPIETDTEETALLTYAEIFVLRLRQAQLADGITGLEAFKRLAAADPRLPERFRAEKWRGTPEQKRAEKILESRLPKGLLVVNASSIQRPLKSGSSGSQ